jgi:hypothetical protein
MTFLGVDDRQSGLAEGRLKFGNDRNAGLNIREVVAERFSESTRETEVTLHVDADEGDVVDVEKIVERLRVDCGHFDCHAYGAPLVIAIWGRSSIRQVPQSTGLKDGVVNPAAPTG